ncbi:MAG: thiosulfate oxidation carrier protein SoxY [Burkholderiales bacterium]|jgi:sulfur-oxidizing protein SoxY|nr:thiosulfate oxidation carrier protein SoxY [Burkholderiales bacterium]
MNTLRRSFIRATGRLALALAAGLLVPLRALAGAWNQPGFDAKTLADALKSIGATTAVNSPDILVKAPEIAENGAIVPIEVVSTIPNTRFIAILAEKNPFPLIGTFDLRDGAEGFVSTRVKLGQTSLVRVIVKTNDTVYSAAREVKVTIGGCGA